MTKSTPSSPVPSCGCTRCHCDRGPRCRCHDLNALIVLALEDYRRALRRNLAT